MKSTKQTNDKKVNLNLKDLTANKDPRGGAKKVSRPDIGLIIPTNHNEMFLKDLTTNKDPRAGMKRDSRPTRNGLTNNHNEMFLKDLTANKDPRGGAKKVSRPRPDGLNNNHNETFLAERNLTMKSSKRSNGEKINVQLKELTPNKDLRGGIRVATTWAGQNWGGISIP